MALSHKKLFKRIIEYLRKYSLWLYYGGFINMTFAAIIFIFKFLQLVRVIGMSEVSRGNNRKMKELNADFKAIEEDWKDEQDSSALWRYFVDQKSDRRAVLMGNKQTIIYIHLANLTVCVLYFVCGYYMSKTSKPMKDITREITENDIEKGPEILKKSKWRSCDRKRVHLKTKTFVKLSIISIIILLLSTALRVACIYDSISRE